MFRTNLFLAVTCYVFCTEKTQGASGNRFRRSTLFTKQFEWVVHSILRGFVGGQILLFGIEKVECFPILRSFEVATRTEQLIHLVYDMSYIYRTRRSPSL